ncbi:MAG: hypothetical protein A3H51_00180 [Candidatus Spechtbacteria bacterium RIFCSPLOWO2_02_FULL_38_8]|uniref:Uncharacterized protein n=1 Tax=Candidatus Spechtbacteria bacterium RIFCSPLOWO2_02_FULL_38_8 TaxID=1802164 RepID=A0A1G2HIP7_9BACT|nr:MAG: hypothetical protein A3H51_00180 [Candidatus Spechtbacteria bacterium RIFCSPLOWO2_02_FULL_38_8]
MSLSDLFKNSLENIIDVLNSILYETALAKVQFFVAIISALLFVFWVYLIIKTETIKSKFVSVKKAVKGGDIPREIIFQKWAEVEQKLNSNYASDWKLAIIGADSILDRLIQSLGYNGETMGERMKNIRPGQFPYLEEAWRAHKVRNFLAHDATYELSRQAAIRTIEIYKNIFTEFGML